MQLIKNVKMRSLSSVNEFSDCIGLETVFHSLLVLPLTLGHDFV